MSGRYDDIIDLPYPVSQRHPQMPLTDRAAQFSPFAALTGLDAALQETARLTDQRITLDEDEQAEDEYGGCCRFAYDNRPSSTQSYRFRRFLRQTAAEHLLRCG